METLIQSTLPEKFDDINHLEEVLTRPSKDLVEDMEHLDGGILVFGASGQLGQTICRLAKRANPKKRIVAVTRSVQSEQIADFESWGVETVTCNLFDISSVANLPHLPNVVVAAGGRFGPQGDRELGWMTNTIIPSIIGEIFSDCRLIAVSSGTVYPLVSVLSQGATEETCTSPVADEFANSCLARERIYQYHSRLRSTSGRIIRLAYAVEVRKGVMQHVARQVLAGKSVDLGIGHVNVIWQGDFASQLLRSFHHCTTPMTPLNVTGPEVVSIRDLASTFGGILAKKPLFEGSESDKMWLVNSGEATRLFGYPVVPLSRMTHWTADWVARDMPHRDGPFPGQVIWPLPS